LNLLYFPLLGQLWFICLTLWICIWVPKGASVVIYLLTGYEERMIALLCIPHHVHGPPAHVKVTTYVYRDGTHCWNTILLVIVVTLIEMISQPITYLLRFSPWKLLLPGWLPWNFDSEIDFDGDRTRSQGYEEPVLISLGHMPFPSLKEEWHYYWVQTGWTCPWFRVPSPSNSISDLKIIIIKVTMITNRTVSQQVDHHGELMMYP
jgi:hypothetical protein